MAMGQARVAEDRTSWLLVASVAGLVLLSCGLLISRIGLEESLWVDETFSLLLTTYPVEVLVAETAADSTPPLYYLLLKAWLKVGRGVPGLLDVFFARLSGVLVFVCSWIFVWRLTRLRFGSTAAWLALVSVACGAAGAAMARDLRAYGLAAALLLACALLLLEIGEGGLSRPPRRRRPLWALYASAAALAVWTQLLSAIALALLFLLWMFLGTRRGERARLTWEGLAASGLAALLFLPWFPKVAGQVRYVSSGADWMTPASGSNLLAALFYWLPFGRIGLPTDLGVEWPIWWGAVAVLLPLGSVLVPLLGRSPSVRGRPAPALVLIGAALGTVVSLWLIDRLGLAETFHGPRHPLLVGPLLAVGVALAAAQAPRRKHRSLLALLLVAPWIGAGIWGQAKAFAQERTWGLKPRLQEVAHLMPPPGDAIHVFPAELTPFYSNTFEGYDLQPMERFSRAVEPARGATVVSVSSWRRLDRPHDHLARAFLGRGLLGRTAGHWSFPAERGDYEVWRIEDLDPAWLDRIEENGFSSALQREHGHGSALALPEAQRERDGWSFFEVDRELQTFRWSTREVATVRFGSNHGQCRTLVIRGNRLPYPESEAEIGVAADEGRVQLGRWRQGPGVFEKRFRLEVEDMDSIRLSHPLWSPATVLGSPDQRLLGLQFLGAWFEDCG